MSNPLNGIFFFIITIAAIGAIVAIFKMKYQAASLMAKQQEENAALLTEISGRLASLEKLLKDVG